MAYLVSLPVSMVVAWRLRRQHARESEQAASPGPEQERGPERIVRLGAGASAAQARRVLIAHPGRVRHRSKAMLDARLRRLIDPPLDRLCAPLARYGLSANLATAVGFAIGLAAMAAIAAQAYGLGLGLLLLNRLLDGLDGALARRQGITDLGGFLDIVCDFIVYAGVPIAFALADPGANALPAAFLIFSFIGTATLVPRLRHHGGQARHHDASCAAGNRCTISAA